MPDETVHVRDMVDDVAAAVDFDTKHLLISGPQSSAGRAMPDGAQPGPGGSQILVQDPAGNLVELFQPAG
jgi:hypothetical protein